MKRYFNILLGSLIIGISFNVFFVPYNLIPSGLIGLGSLYKETYNLDPAIFIAIANLFLLLIALPVLGEDKTETYLLTSLFIPLVIFATQNISRYIYFDNLETIIIAVAGAIICGYGYSIIYKEGASVGGFETIQAIFNETAKSSNRHLSYFIELSIVILTAVIFNFEMAVYSLIIIAIITYMTTKAKIGISSNKTFFIITNKEKEIKDYLINDLKYDFTEFNVKGGFTNHKSKIIMSVIDTKDYYKLKEGIALIDSNAFISIIDGYETINKNVAINANNNYNY